MNKKRILQVSIAITSLLIVVGVIYFIIPIRLGYSLDEFKFMSHSITEGNQLENIMNENNIEYFTGAVCDKDFYAHKNNQGTISIMCPAYHNQDDAPDSTIPEEERRHSWASGYTVTDTSIPGVKEVVSITINSTQKNIAEYYEGPINVGDTMDEVRSIMEIDNIKKYGVYDNNARYETYSFNCNQGTIIFEEKCSGHRDEYDKYSDKLEYLADGHYITYVFSYSDYVLGVTIGEEGTVDNIAISYDPERVLK